MTDAIISVENLGRGRLGERRAARCHRRKSALLIPQSAIRNPQSDDFWALRGVILKSAAACTLDQAIKMHAALEAQSL